MSLIDLLIMLVIAGFCGSIARSLAGGGSRGGCLVSIAVGFIGAVLGSWIGQQLKLPQIVKVGGIDLAWSIMGGALFCALLGFLSRRNR